MNFVNKFTICKRLTKSNDIAITDNQFIIFCKVLDAVSTISFKKISYTYFMQIPNNFIR